MPDAPVELAHIATQAKRSAWTRSWCFILISPTNQVHMASDEFSSGGKHPRNWPEEHAVLDRFLQRVRDQDWEIVARPSGATEWWAFQFARGDPAAVARERQLVDALARFGDESVPQDLPRSRWWGCLTILIFVALVLCFAVLAIAYQISQIPW